MYCERWRFRNFSTLELRRIWAVGMDLNDRIILNISGEIYETQIQTARRFPDTLLGCDQKRFKFFNSETGHYQFNRNKIFFDAILYFYQSSGILRCPPGIPLYLFKVIEHLFNMYPQTRPVQSKKYLITFRTGLLQSCPHVFWL